MVSLSSRLEQSGVAAARQLALKTSRELGLLCRRCFVPGIASLLSVTHKQPEARDRALEHMVSHP